MSKLLVHDPACICNSDQIWELIPDGSPSDDNDDCNSDTRVLLQRYAANPSKHQAQWPPLDSGFAPTVGEEYYIMGCSARNFSAPPPSPTISRKVIAPLTLGADDHDIARAELAGNQSPSKAGQGVSVSCEKRSLKVMASDHETHIWTERERRKKMRTMFATLHALLPHLAAKTDKSTIVDEAISYIKSLERSRQMLQKRLERARADAAVEDGSFQLQAEYSCATAPVLDAMVDHPQPTPTQSSMKSRAVDYSLQTWSSPNVVLSVCGEDAQIGICSARKPGLLPTIFYTLEKHNVDVVTAQISGNNYGCMFMIHARVSPSAATETFKLAIGDLVLYLSS